MRHQNRSGPERPVFPDETCMKTNMAPLRGWGPKEERLPGPAPFGTGTRRLSSPPCVTTGSTRPVCSTARSTVRSSWPRSHGCWLRRCTRAAWPLPQESERFPGDPRSRRARALPAAVHPDLNPIEQACARIKHRLHNAAARSRHTFRSAVGEALENIELQECANHLRNAEYGSHWTEYALSSGRGSSFASRTE